MKNILYKLFIIAILFTLGIKSNLPAQDDLIRTIGMGNLYCIAYSPDGTKLASAGSSGYVYIWDINTGNVIDTLKGHTDDVRSVAFSPDGSKIASGSADNTIKLWDANTGALIRTFVGHTDYVLSVAFSPDGSKIASGCWDGTIKMWRVPSTTNAGNDLMNNNSINIFPNPANEQTQIVYNLVKPSSVNITLQNLLGVSVAQIENVEYKNSGTYSIDYDVSGLENGVYLLSIFAGNEIRTKKLVLSR